MRSCAKSPACGDVRLVPSGGSGTDQTERSSREELAGLRIPELIRPSRSSGTDRSERSSGKEMVELRIRELIRSSRSSGIDPIEQGLGN
ncbi:hypothetical protein B296_00042521 [Ensete ventricosum]|uniref:Uncharacterized protein n=1 Tax=Ensete ventricosum TaxID=4639 RepID=A0A426XXJ7_ENSVE|nr:hypothetical protein B296_00042521 [Ensete ventricosum]